jgi:hypothetical protein
LRITNVDLLDESGITVGTGGGVCTVVSVPPLDTLEQCLITPAFVDGQIIFGGLARSPEVGVTGRFGILGGTDGFREARGEATLVVISTEGIDATFELEIDSTRQPRPSRSDSNNRGGRFHQGVVGEARRVSRLG